MRSDLWRSSYQSTCSTQISYHQTAFALLSLGIEKKEVWLSRFIFYLSAMDCSASSWYDHAFFTGAFDREDIWCFKQMLILWCLDIACFIWFDGLYVPNSPYFLPKIIPNKILLPSLTILLPSCLPTLLVAIFSIMLGHVWFWDLCCGVCSSQASLILWDKIS